MSGAERRLEAIGSARRPERHPAGSQGFPKRRRLRKRPEFLSVQREGRAAHGRYVLALARARDGQGKARAETRVGITVSKKVGSAVVRNRIKRLIREYARRHELAPGRDVVIISKRKAARARGYRDIARDLDRIGRELG